MEPEVSAPKVSAPQEASARRPRPPSVYRRRRLRLVWALGALCLLIVAIVIAAAASNDSGQVTDETLTAGLMRSTSAPVTAVGDQHPAFTRLGDRNLLLPVAAGDATIIAYQAISDERAVALTPIGDKINTNALVRFFRGIFSGEASVRYYQLEGVDGAPTSSVLVGAAPGSPVTAPVTGVVTKVKEYLLFGKYEDFQIEIRPEKMGGVTVTLIFIDEPAVSIGDSVTAGKTWLGKVRECPQGLNDILCDYTHDSGSHVMMYVTGELAD